MTYCKRIAKQLPVPTILHICGKASKILSHMAEVADGSFFIEQVRNHPGAIPCLFYRFMVE